MGELPEAVKIEWRRRVVAEYGSAAITHGLLGWLLRLGASPTVLPEVTRIVDDELVHAEQAFAVLCEAGGGSDVTLGGDRPESAANQPHMAGRESRSRLLVPSFVVVATAMACGKTDAGDVSMNPPPQIGGSTGQHSAGAPAAGGAAN